MQCIYEFLLILIVLYIIGNVLKNVLYENVAGNERKRFLTKWATVNIGLVLALIGAYLLGEWCLILPLFIVLVAGLIWMLLLPKQNSLRASAKSWQMVLSGRAKTIMKNNETKEEVVEKTTTVTPEGKVEETKKETVIITPPPISENKGFSSVDLK
jgi:hypothetical protein